MRRKNIAKGSDGLSNAAEQLQNGILRISQQNM
jgi:hypothetical protein